MSKIYKRENDFQADMIEFWESKTGFIFNIHGSEWQKGGMPDLLVHHRRWHGYLELKVGRRVLESLQKKRIKEIHARWFDAFVIYPNRIEDEEGVTLAAWTWDTLIFVLIELSQWQRS